MVTANLKKSEDFMTNTTAASKYIPRRPKISMNWNPTFQAFFFVRNWRHQKDISKHSVLERIWVKGSNLSQWLPQGERGPPKESKSRWIEILHGGSQFTLWFLKIKIFQKFSDHSEIFFCFTIHKKLNKSCSLKKKILFLKKNILSLKKTLKKKFVSGTHRGGFQCIMILTP